MQKLTSVAVLTLVLLFVQTLTADAALAPARWRYSTVCVEDRTGSRWTMVDDAVRRYNTHPDLAVAYRRNCSGFRQVVKVYAGWYGKTGWAGQAQLAWSGGYFVSPMKIKLNNTYAYRDSWRVRLHIVSHELGHTLGLGHTHRRDSVMGPDPQVGFATPFDFAELERRYPW